MVCQQALDAPKAPFLREKWCASKPWIRLKAYLVRNFQRTCTRLAPTLHYVVGSPDLVGMLRIVANMIVWKL